MLAPDFIKCDKVTVPLKHWVGLQVPGTRLAEKVKSLEPTLVRSPSSRLDVNTTLPPSLTVKVPLLKVHVMPEGLQLVGDITRFVSAMVIPFPLTDRLIGLCRLDVIVPVAELPVLNSILFAKAAVGKATAKSVKSITCFILVLL